MVTLSKDFAPRTIECIFIDLTVVRMQWMALYIYILKKTKY